MEWSQLWQVLLSFGCVVALLLGLGYLVRRFGLEKKWQVFRSRSGMITLADSMFLDQKRRVVLIDVMEKRYVIMLDQERAHLLDTLPHPGDNSTLAEQREKGIA
jgi:flagellar biogenesis protein FliO